MSPKKVKAQQEQIISSLRQAMAAMGDDFAMLEARNHILQAMQLVSKVAGRRINRITAAQRFQEEAKRNCEKWWQKIQENALKLAKENIEKLDGPIEGQMDSST